MDSETYFEVNITYGARETPYVSSPADALLKQYGATIIDRKMIDRDGDFVLLYITAHLAISLDDFIAFRISFREIYRNAQSFPIDEQPFKHHIEIQHRFVAEIVNYEPTPQWLEAVPLPL